MHAWVFRHRVRLRAIFGAVRPNSAATTGDSASHAPRRPQGGETPGTVLRRSRYVLIYPMPRPA
ncbi:MAG: hypothetical protein VYE81_11245 [Planctomycetota bacterium]|nr:hypothetical protein [Planctomycetota bacterium]